jgi:acetylglutamate kinase
MPPLLQPVAVRPGRNAIRRLHVIKVGGTLISNPAFLQRLGTHVSGLVEDGCPTIVVHGGGDLVTDLQRRLGVPETKHGGLRATSEEGMQLVTMALRGLANARLVAQLVSCGVEAIGVSGVDLGLLRSDYLNRARLGRVGGPPRVAAGGLARLLTQGLVPVIAPVCLGPAGGLLNVNADTVAHAVAASLEADCLDFVSDVPGVLGEEGQVVRSLSQGEVRALLEGPRVWGGMIPKLQASLAAVSAGVSRVRIGDLESLGRGGATEVVL